ncbi:MAG: hypothetical protein KDA28_04300, partial [Phycisphaerales bacterium]|nr:hypothetical protein [Phycisphaerales bacterium]
GGLPEVFIGCGVAIRRSVFLELGGYDHTFEYYVEEYDLAARMIGAGYHIVFEPDFLVDHHKVESGRDFSRIVERLVRNNGWVIERYAPSSLRTALHRETRRRYREIARREGAVAGYARAIHTLRATVRTQGRRPLTNEAFDRFTGLAHARRALEPLAGERCTIVAPGKNRWVVEQALAEIGATLVEDGIPVIGTMSPGPMLDALQARPDAVAPWTGAFGSVETKRVRGRVA